MSTSTQLREMLRTDSQDMLSCTVAFRYCSCWIPPRILVFPAAPTQPLAEMSTRNLSGGKGGLARKVDLTAICDPIVYKMCEP
jgi:hypothetical protein